MHTCLGGPPISAGRETAGSTPQKEAKTTPGTNLCFNTAQLRIMPTNTPHPLTRQHLRATGAPAGGYEIPSTGIVFSLHDASGSKVKAPFRVKRNISLEEAAAELEQHICKHGKHAGQHWNEQ